MFKSLNLNTGNQKTFLGSWNDTFLRLSPNLYFTEHLIQNI